ncbi:MAG: tetratricopeptide repeat protein [Cyanobacteriota bacterium]|nr:tetratricopeptide repeat protein [Cyanobacteriota bacterium]
MTCSPFPPAPEAIEPNNFHFWFERGEQFFKKKQYAEALECYDRALDSDPDNVQAWLCHGGTLTHLDRYVQAVISFEAALHIEPDNKVALLYKGFALQHIGQYEQAYLLYDRARGIQRNPISSQLQRWGHKILDAVGFREK